MDKQKLEKAAYILKTIAHPTRLAIISILNEHEALTVSEIVKLTGCEQSLMSHHLINLKTKGLLSARRDGTNIFYSLKEKNLTQVVGCINNCNIYM